MERGKEVGGGLEGGEELRDRGGEGGEWRGGVGGWRRRVEGNGGVRG